MCWSSFCKRIGSVEVVATIFPGNVHTALKRQAAFRLLILVGKMLLKSRNSVQFDCFNWNHHRMSRFSYWECWYGLWYTWFVHSRRIQKAGEHGIQEIGSFSFYTMNHEWMAELTKSAGAISRQLDEDVQGTEHRVDKTGTFVFFYDLKSKFWGHCRDSRLFSMLYNPII